MQHVVIVGASLAGLRTAEELHQSKWEGKITLVGEESHPPYTRPPLSKSSASGLDDPHAAVALKSSLTDTDVTWTLGDPAVASDLKRGTVELRSGEVLEFDGLVVATGVRARRLPIVGPATGIQALRTLDDANQASQRLTPGQRVVVIGAGFIGCEVASTARGAGCSVDVVTMDPVPMLMPLGHEVGGWLAARHEKDGVVFHTGRTVAEFIGTDRLEGVVLDDGRRLEADLVIEAIGSMCNTEWLDGNGVDLSDGVLVNNALTVDAPIPVVAVGDVVRFPNPLFDDVPRRVEHWQMATTTARRGGQALASALLAESPVEGQPFTPLPSFWSDQGQIRMQSFGMPALANNHALVNGSPEGDFALSYERDGRPVAVVTVGMPKEAVRLRKWLMEQL